MIIWEDRNKHQLIMMRMMIMIMMVITMWMMTAGLIRSKSLIQVYQTSSWIQVDNLRKSKRKEVRWGGRKGDEARMEERQSQLHY